MKKQLMIFDFVYTGIAAILLLTIAILQNCGINITHENVIGIIVLIILFVLILLSTVNVLGCNYPTSKITFLRPILLFIAGGSDSFSSLAFSGFHALHALDENACSPFNHSTGITLGGGSGILVIESYEHAVERGV